MKTMASTKTRMSATTGAMTHGSAALSVPITAGSRHRPDKGSDPADHDRDKALDQEADAEIGEQAEHRHQQRAGKPRQRRAEGEGRAVHRSGRNARRPRQRRILQRGADAQAERGARQQEIAADHDEQRDDDDHEAPRRDVHAAEIDRSADRLRHRQIEPADQPAHALADDQPKRIGPEHGHDGRGVEAPDDERFEHETERADQKRRGDHPGPDREPVAVGQIGDVGAEQNELALREVEDSHHAGDDSEPQHDQNDDRAETQDLESCDESVSHVSRSSRAASAGLLHLFPVAGLLRRRERPDRSSIRRNAGRPASIRPEGRRPCRTAMTSPDDG